MKDIISTNDLSQRVVVEYHDEIGQLAQTFNLMVGELEKAYHQIKQYRLQRGACPEAGAEDQEHLPAVRAPDVIDEVFKNPEKMLVGKDEVLAVLFSDIRSFTSISEKMRPDELVTVLNSYFKVMVDIIMARNGVVDKYIGDAIMAFFGAPVRRQDDGLQSVMAGIEMIDALKGWNADQEKKGKPPFHIGVGIHYGVVTVGNMGMEKKMNYTVIGDTVNLASRLEGLTKYYHQTLIISESLHPKVKDAMSTRLLDTVAVKGKKKGVRIYTASTAPSSEEKDAWELHNAAMDEYYKRNFSRASSLFRDVHHILPGDEVSHMLMQRSQDFVKNPPPPSWDGVHEMTTK